MICDLNNDESQDVMAASSWFPNGHIYWNVLESFDNNLANWTEFSVRNQSNKPINSPVISDLNNDGLIDITLVNMNGDIYIYELNFPYYYKNSQWPAAQRDMYNSKRYYVLPISGELDANSAIEWSGEVRISGDVILPATSTLNIQPGTKVIFEYGDDEKSGADPVKPELIVYGTLNVNGTENNMVEMFSYSQWQGIIVMPAGKINLNYCWIDKAVNGIEIKPTTELSYNHQIIHCEISNCIKGIMASSNLVTIQNSEIHQNHTGIELYETQFNISYNSIHSNKNYGVYLSNTSSGEITYNTFESNSNNTSDWPLAAVYLYHSSPGIYSNQIKNNFRNGLVLMNNSFPAIDESNLFENNGPVIPLSEPAWDKAEILMQDICLPYMDYGHNDLVDNREEAGYLMMHAGEPDDIIRINGNYWGSPAGPHGRLYPVEYYEAENWDTEPNTSGEPLQRDPEEQLFINSLTAEKQGYYSTAKAGYQQIISNYPDSLETEYALQRLYICETALNGNFDQLRNYYQNLSQNFADSVKIKISDNLSRRCLVKMIQLNPAILELEGIIQNPATLEDSIYSVIDIGEIYLLQDELINQGGMNLKMGNMGGNSGNPVLRELEPANRQQFEEKKHRLLSLLFNKKNSNGNLNIPTNYALNQNYPNPFNPVTTIKYQLPKLSKVKLEIYNILGQRIKTIQNGSQEAGYYKM